MNIRSFLRRNRLPLVWLQDQLSKRGIDVESSHLSRIIDRERNSDNAQEIRMECERICRKYAAL